MHFLAPPRIRGPRAPQDPPAPVAEGGVWGVRGRRGPPQGLGVPAREPGLESPPPEEEADRGGQTLPSGGRCQSPPGDRGGNPRGETGGLTWSPPRLLTDSDRRGVHRSVNSGAPSTRVGGLRLGGRGAPTAGGIRAVTTGLDVPVLTGMWIGNSSDADTGETEPPGDTSPPGGRQIGAPGDPPPGGAPRGARGVYISEGI